MTAQAAAVSRSVMGSTLPFALPIGLSAFLLFSVEPLVGRLVLPVFGGAAAVWATILFFFQAVLLAGYLYGHVSVTRLGRLGPPIHLVLVALAFFALVNAPARIADLRNEAVTPVLDLLWMLIGLIGLPAFVLTSTTPLLSGWFHAADDEGHLDPYWLYALSNAGSLAALLAYPLLIEPRLGLASQRGIWASGYAVLAVLVGWAAYRALPHIGSRVGGRLVAAQQPHVAGEASSASSAITARRRLRWLFLAMIPSGLLSAVTNFIATDLVSAPLLWVIPLALYLASFIVAFSPRGGRIIRVAAAAAPAMVTLLWVPYGSAGGWPILALLITELLAFAVVAIAIHGRLAQDRPDPVHLTEFYLILATGGALASAFVALLAPIVFPDIWEYPILLVGALVALALVAGPRTTGPRVTSAGRRPGLDFGPFFAGWRGRLLPYAVGAGLLAVVLVATGSIATEAGIRWLLVGGLILLFGGKPAFVAVATAIVLGLATFVLKPPAEFRARSFFGVTEVLHVPRDDANVMMNGTTVHGAQLSDPAERRTPVSYYGAEGPVGDIFTVLAGSSAIDPRRVAVVGLGAGGIAGYADSRTEMTFYEIDPIVISAASDSRLFTFLSDAPRRPRVVLGDARLSLAAEPDATYDLLIMDAFTSDSVPIHLLTLEGITDEVRTLAPDGVIAFNVSSRYYDLSPAIAAALAAVDVVTLRKSGAGKGGVFLPSIWIAGSRSPDRLNSLRAVGWEASPVADRPFTDDYADLLSYLHLGQ